MEIAREECGLSWTRLTVAFAAYGYRWADEDPHRADERKRQYWRTPSLS